MENFIKDKWYKTSNNGLTLYYAKCFSFLEGIMTASEFNVNGYIKQNYSFYTGYTWVEASIEEIQFFLPEDHPEKLSNKIAQDTKFIVGKWYKYNYGEGYYMKCIGFEKNLFLNDGFISVSTGIYTEQKGSYLLKYYEEEITLSEIQKYLPDNHPDKIVKPIEECGVGSYIVNIDSSWRSSYSGLTDGKIYEIVKKSTSTSHITNDNGVQINFRHDEIGDGLKWFATLQEAEAFSETLLAKEAVVEVPVPDPIVEDPLITEARKRYPIGTKFYPAHLPPPVDLYCTVTTDKFYMSQKNIYAVPIIGDYNGVTDLSEGDGNTYSRLLYSEAQDKWAEIVTPKPTSTVVEEPEQKEEIVHCLTRYEWDIVLSIFNPLGLSSVDWDIYTNNTCLILSGKYSGCRVNINYTNASIISFKDWCIRINISQKDWSPFSGLPTLTPIKEKNLEWSINNQKIELLLKEETELLNPVKIDLNLSNQLLII